MILADHLVSIGACEAAIEWALGRPMSEESWLACPRGDWLLWWAEGVCHVDTRRLVRAACLCAREALVYVPRSEPRPLLAIEAAEAWCRDEASVEDVLVAAHLARAAADSQYETARGVYYACLAAAQAAEGVDPGMHAEGIDACAASSAADAASLVARRRAYVAAGPIGDANERARTRARSRMAARVVRSLSHARSADLVRSVITWDACVSARLPP